MPAVADLYGELLLDDAPRPGWRAHVPGLMVAALATMAAAYLSDHYGAPLTLMALLIGLALNFLNADQRLAPGLAFASRTLLRAGIVLVGLRVTFGQMGELGPAALAALVVIVAATLAAGVVAARAFGFSSAFGTLAGGSVAICGASAAMAVAALLGEKRASQAQLALVLVGVSAASSLAMFLYPIVAHQMGMTEAQAGFLIGASIHDVAQALGAGYSFSQHAGETAAIVKLTRVAMLAPVLAMLALFFVRDKTEGKGVAALPWFVVGFFALAGVNSLVAVPAIVSDWAQTGASALLACAVAATGIRSPMDSLLRSGARPLLVIAAATLVSLLLSIAAALLLIR